MKKIYARQVPPEYQESPLFMDEWPENVIVTGNRDFNSHTTAAYDTITGNMDSAADDMNDDWYTNVTAYFNDVFPPEHKPGYSTKDIAHWKRIAKDWQSARPDEVTALICQALCLMTGKQYDHAGIRGCCQGDWQECFYPADFNPDFIKYFETEYFNTGTEWMIHDKDEAPENPDDINGYTMYCYTYRPAEEIAREYGADMANVVLYGFDGYTQTARYKEVSA